MKNQFSAHYADIYIHKPMKTFIQFSTLSVSLVQVEIVMYLFLSLSFDFLSQIRSVAISGSCDSVGCTNHPVHNDIIHRNITGNILYL